MSSTTAIPAPTGAAPIDPQLLAQLATSLFRSLPGDAPSPVPGAQAPANWAPGGSPLAAPSGMSPNVPGTPIPLGQVPGSNLLPSSPGNSLSLVNRAPALLPQAQAGNGVPDKAFAALPGYEPRLAGLVNAGGQPAPSGLDALSQQAVQALASHSFTMCPSCIRRLSDLERPLPPAQRPSFILSMRFSCPAALSRRPSPILMVHRMER